MNGFVDTMESQALWLLGNPSSSMERTFTLVLGLTALWALVSRISQAMGSPMKGPGGAMGGTALGALLVVVGCAAAVSFAPREVSRAGWFPAARVLGSIVLLAVPAVARLYAGKFSKTLIAWLVGALGFGAAVQITDAGMGSLITGESNKKELLK